MCDMLETACLAKFNKVSYLVR